MAGRRAHIGNDRFAEFFETLPEESRAQGYWRIKRETISESGVGGVVQAMLGFIPFNAQESYESLKGRIKDSFAVNKGPGTYYAIPCDDRKRELKDVDMVKVEFTEKEVPMPVPNGQNGDSGSSGGDPMKDVMDTMKKTMKDNAELKAMKIREKMLSKMAADDDDEEDDDVKDNASDLLGGGGLSNMLLYRQLFEDNKKDKGGDSELKDMMKEMLRSQQPKGDPEVKALLAELVRSQRDSQPKGDPEMKALLEKLLHEKQSEKQESTLQTIFAMQLKQQEERDKVRQDEMRVREEERKEERRQNEERMRLDRQKYEDERKEREATFKAEMEIRRQEMKQNESSGKHALTEQQQLQMKMFEFLSSNKNSGMDHLKTMVEMMTGAGLSSMKTAQSAADAIVSIAQKSARDDKDDDEKGGGVMEILKNLAPLAGSLLGPYANANAQGNMLQQLAGALPPGMSIDQLLAGLGGMPRGGGGPVMPPQMPKQPKMVRPPVTEAPAPAPSAAPKASDTKDNGGMAMIIAKVLKDNPEIKHMMIGNMQEKMGVDMFVDFLYDFDIPGVDKMIAMMPPQVLMQFVKASCTPDEAKVIDANLQWFIDLKRVVLEEIKAEKEEDEAEDATDKVVKDVVAGTAPTVVATPPAPAPAPAPAAANPAPAPAAQV